MPGVLDLPILMGASFSPRDLSSLWLWLKADSLVLADGTAVGTWADQSGNGRDVTQATADNKPTYKTAILNGKPVVRFDGTNDSLANAAVPALGTSDFTIFVVVKTTTLTGYKSPFFFGTGALNQAFLLSTDGTNNDGTLVWGRWANNFLDCTAPSLVANVFAIITAHDSGDTFSSFINGAATTAASNDEAINIVGTGIIIAAITGGGQEWPGDIAEFIVYNRALGTNERRQVEKYLGSKYGIAVS